MKMRAKPDVVLCKVAGDAAPCKTCYRNPEIRAPGKHIQNWCIGTVFFNDHIGKYDCTIYIDRWNIIE